MVTQLTSVGGTHSALAACKYRHGGTAAQSCPGELDLGMEDAEKLGVQKEGMRSRSICL